MIAMWPLSTQRRGRGQHTEVTCHGSVRIGPRLEQRCHRLLVAFEGGMVQRTAAGPRRAGRVASSRVYSEWRLP
eukprot:3891789-Prymnesium_polylepis.2